jgi:hypothetical protein
MAPSRVFHTRMSVISLTITKSEIQVGWFITLRAHNSWGEHMVMRVPNTYVGQSKYMIDGGIYVSWEEIESWRPPNLSTARYMGLE